MTDAVGNKTSPSYQDAIERIRRESFILLPAFLLLIVSCICFTATIAPLGLVPQRVPVSGVSVLNADYGPWEYRELDLDIDRLATAVAQGDQSWLSAHTGEDNGLPSEGETVADSGQAETPEPTDEVAEISLPGATLTAPIPALLTPTVLPTASGTLSATPTSTPITPPPTSQPTSSAQADLAITKTDGVSSVNQGGSVTYTIQVTNNGPQNVSGATVTDSFSSKLSGISWTCSGAGGATCTASGSGNINDTVNLPVGSNVTYTASATVRASATGTLSNTASAALPSGMSDPNTGNNSNSDSDSIIVSGPQADLRITNSDGVSSVAPNDSLTYTVVVSNLGPSSVTGATVTDTFTSQLTSITWTCAGTGGASCAASGSGNINSTANLPAGGTATYTISGTVSSSATGTLSSTASVSPPSGVTDPVTGNNSAIDTDTISAISTDLSVSVSASTTTVLPGDPVTFTVTVDNLSGTSVSGATVANTVPSQLTSVNWTCTPTGGATCNAASGSGSVGGSVNLPGGSRVTYTVNATVAASASGSFTYTVQATPPSGVVDTNNGNNSAGQTLTVTSLSGDLSAAISANISQAARGQTITYTLTFANAGPNNATNAPLQGITPFSPTLDNVTWTCSGAGGAVCGSASGTGNIPGTGSLPATGSLTYTVTGRVPAAASGSINIDYYINVPGGFSDPNLGNNDAAVSVTVLSGLVVTYTGTGADTSPGDGVCWDGTGCSLQAAIEENNALGTPGTVNFNIPGAGPFVINPPAEFVDVLTRLTIDGTTQPGYSGTPLIVIDGTGTAPVDSLDTEGLEFHGAGASGSILRGVSISNFVSAIEIESASNVTIENNYLLSSNEGIEIFIGATNNTVQNNLISGNITGVLVDGSGTNGNVIQNNRIGTNAAGDAAFANQDGIRINNASNTQIRNNVVSGNSSTGIWLTVNATSTLIDSNLIGVNAAGSGALGNGLSGITLNNGSNNATITNNTISANGQAGITVSNSSSANIQSNRIGTRADGSGNLGNADNGVRIQGTSAGIQVRQNTMADNANPGIDLNDDGVTANDSGDGDSGPNGLQNYPLISSANIVGGGNLNISGTLNSLPSASFTIDIYKNPVNEQQGRVYLGSTTASTNPSGNANWSANLSVSISAGEWVTVTATHSATNNTSEFSPTVQAN